MSRNIDVIISKIKVNQEWLDRYKFYVPKFIEEAKTKTNWQDWDPEIFYEFFEKNREQCVSSLQQGYYTLKEQEAIKDNWIELSPLLKKIAENQDVLDLDAYGAVLKWIRHYTVQNRKASGHRLIAGLQPNLLSSIIQEDRLKNFMSRVNQLNDEPIFKIENNWFKNSNLVLEYFKSKIPHTNVMDVMTYPWETYDYLSNINEKNKADTILENDADLKGYKSILKYKKQIILQGPPGTGKTRLAKNMAAEMLGLTSIKELQNNDQFNLIQFHPSYTYEDFVRGIVSKPNTGGEGVLYESENKILAKLAGKALENYTLSKEEKTSSSVFNRFVNYVIEEIGEHDKFMISDKVYIDFVDETKFKYKGDNWTAHPNGLNMNFSELKKIIEFDLASRKEINKDERLKSLTRQHATYFQNVIELYNTFKKESSQRTQEKETLKNYVLIIDEINRANLSSVLGELIYALEYRGVPIESMYEVDDSNQLILPSNLFIIGTMNTADRSVGHIDYAVRRRFAFVDVLPKDLSDDVSITFYSDLFEEVKSLFTTDGYQTQSVYLSEEFEPKEVALGHSYFIDKTDEGGSMDVRLEYEIKPILREYIRDGILKETARVVIERLGAI